MTGVLTPIPCSTCESTKACDCLEIDREIARMKLVWSKK